MNDSMLLHKLKKLRVNCHKRTSDVINIHRIHVFVVILNKINVLLGYQYETPVGISFYVIAS